MQRLTTLSHLVFAALCSFTVAACTIGEEAVPSEGGVRYTDSDGDGKGDGVDTDGDGKPDYGTPECPTCLPGDAPLCLDPIVDEDNDGLPEGLDLDCDGVIDIPFNFDEPTDPGDPGQPGGGGNGGTVGQISCVSVIAINNDKKAIECSSDASGVVTCRCERNDALEKTCTTTLSSPCDQSYPTVAGENCCGY